MARATPWALRPFFWFLFSFASRVYARNDENRRKSEKNRISTMKFNQTSFLSVRPTFSPSCTFNLTWPFRSERLIFFIIWCLLASSDFSHTARSLRAHILCFLLSLVSRGGWRESETCEKAVHILIIACEESMDSQPKFGSLEVSASFAWNAFSPFLDSYFCVRTVNVRDA